MKTEVFNKLIAKLGTSIKFLNINDKFLDQDGNLSRDLFPYLLHPNEKAYQIWADALKPQLAAWLGPMPPPPPLPVAPTAKPPTTAPLP